MAVQTTRRELLRAGVAAAGAAALPLPVWARGLAEAERADAGLLPPPPFYWGVGLENGWMAQSTPGKDGGRRVLDVYEQMQHWSKWKEDLQRAADVGVSSIRYSVPWYRAEPKTGQYDWSLVERAVEHMVLKLKIIPVFDILHYGTPTWMEDGIADDRFVDALTAYTIAMAAHFRGLVNHYTPQNQPQINALFCGGTGAWPPYAKTPESWSKLGVKLARALVQQSRAIRQEAPEAVLISANAFVLDNFARSVYQPAPDARPSPQLQGDVALFPASLAMGRIDPAHPLAAFLLQNGVTQNEINWFQQNYANPDIHGIGYFPELEAAELKGDFAGVAGQTLEQSAKRAAQLTEERCRLAYSYFKAPVCLSEVSAGLNAEKKTAFMRALYDSVLAMRADGIPLRGVYWWPLFDTIQWEYREQASSPLESFLKPGGWNNGLYTSRADGRDLVRVHTAAADTYRELIRRDREERGPVRTADRRAPNASPEAAALLAVKASTWVPSDPPNSPMGRAYGILPGRVTWARDARVATWDGRTGRWWESLDQDVFDRMLSNSLNTLTGEKSNESAWSALFRHYNAQHGRGNRGWQAGESIVIKININNSSRVNQVDNSIDQSAQGLRAMLAQLTRAAKVDPACIVVYDAKRSISERLFGPLSAEFPGVRWMDASNAPGHEPPAWVENAITYTSPEVEIGNALPKACVDAAYMINMALLKGHEMAGVTLCAKNHYGSIQNPAKDHARYITPYRHDITNWSGLVDLMASPNLGGKTMLYVLDGVYGTQTNVQGVGERDRWRRLFNGEWSASLFLSQDAVAIDSVGLDFLRSEFQHNLGFSGARAYPRGAVVNCDNYLHEAALGRNVKLGAYRPNGVECGSLGVHEHWNNAADKQYSRNLDPKSGKGIELVRV